MVQTPPPPVRKPDPPPPPPPVKQPDSPPAPVAGSNPAPAPAPDKPVVPPVVKQDTPAAAALKPGELPLINPADEEAAKERRADAPPVRTPGNQIAGTGPLASAWNGLCLEEQRDAIDINALGVLFSSASANVQARFVHFLSNTGSLVRATVVRPPLEGGS